MVSVYKHISVIRDPNRPHPVNVLSLERFRKVQATNFSRRILKCLGYDMNPGLLEIEGETIQTQRHAMNAEQHANTV
jgi:hypothetical protein